MGQSAEIVGGRRSAETGRERNRRADGRRTIVRQSQREEQTLFLSIFETNLGWFGLLGTGSHVVYLTIGHDAADKVQRALRRADASPAANRAKNASLDDWIPPLRRKLEQYAQGDYVDFSGCLVADFAKTPFQRRILTLTRSIPYGETISYGELAAAAGFPRAARAVGTVMAQNRVPLIIPCHRVVGTAGRLGGFSAPRGVAFKKRLLELESAALAAPNAADALSNDYALGAITPR